QVSILTGSFSRTLKLRLFSVEHWERHVSARWILQKMTWSNCKGSVLKSPVQSKTKEYGRSFGAQNSRSITTWCKHGSCTGRVSGKQHSTFYRRPDKYRIPRGRI